MRINEITAKLGISPQSLSNWIKRHDTFFSEGAKLKRRQLTERDLDILATINRLSNDGVSHEDIANQLANGELDSFEDVTVGIDMRMIPTMAAEQMIDASQIRKELELKETALIKAQEQIISKDNLILELKDEIAELKHKLGRAEAESEIYKKLAGLDKDSEK